MSVRGSSDLIWRRGWSGSRAHVRCVTQGSEGRRREILPWLGESVERREGAVCLGLVDWEVRSWTGGGRGTSR